MTAPTEDFVAGLLGQAVELFVARLKDEGLAHDDRPPLTLEQAARRLNVSPRVMGDMTRGKKGQAPVLATIKVIPGGFKGVMIEAAEIDRYLLECRRASWVAAAGRNAP